MAKPQGLGSAGKFGSYPGKTARKNPRMGQNLPEPGSMEPPRGTTRVSQGPRLLGLGQQPEYIGGPTESFLAQFVGGTISKSEGMLYWAFLKVLGPEGDQWSYQQALGGGRHQEGGAVIDYVVYQGQVDIGVRLVTYRFHFNVDAFKQAHDWEQYRAFSQANDFIVIDVFEDQFIHDRTGKAAIDVVYAIINRQERPNPLATGFVIGTG